VIEGLEDNRFAIYIKVHHALTDGVGAIPLLTQALAERPDGSWSAPWHHKTTPPDAAGSGSPRRVALKTALGTAAPLARGLVSRKRGSSPEAVCRPFQAPDSVINGTITGARRVATQQLDLARIKSVAKRTNTLVRRMAVSHLALVVWQADGGGEPDVVLQAIRPLLDELSSDSPVGPRRARRRRPSVAHAEPHLGLAGGTSARAGQRSRAQGHPGGDRRDRCRTGWLRGDPASGRHRPYRGRAPSARDHHAVSGRLVRRASAHRQLEVLARAT